MSNYANGNQIQQKKPKFSAMLQTRGFQQALQNSLTDKKEIQQFTAAITSVVSTNPQLEECEASTILSAALCGHALGLPPSPQLGQYYMVPFKDRKNSRTVATFVLGYRGYIQLAIRSGQYKRINVVEIKEGELISWDPLTEDIQIKMIQNEDEREAAETVGYYAYFRYTNGFEKALYWSKEKMKQHALKYSAGYANDVRKGTDYTFWSKDFDGMAKKTMLRQLISKWGVMSVEMQSAYEADNHLINDNGTPDYNTTNDYVEATEAPKEIEAQQSSPSEAPEQTATEAEAPPSEGETYSIDDLLEE